MTFRVECEINDFTRSHGVVEVVFVVQRDGARVPVAISFGPKRSEPTVTRGRIYDLALSALDGLLGSALIATQMASMATAMLMASGLGEFLAEET